MKTLIAILSLLDASLGAQQVTTNATTSNITVTIAGQPQVIQRVKPPPELLSAQPKKVSRDVEWMNSEKRRYQAMRTNTTQRSTNANASPK